MSVVDDDELQLTPDVAEEVAGDIASLEPLVWETDECDALCSAALERLQSLWDELQQRAGDSDERIRAHRVVPRVRSLVARCSHFVEQQSGKKLLARLAACRSAADGARRFHEEIDELAQLLALDDVPEWREQWEEHGRALHEQVGELVDNDYQDVGKGLAAYQLLEVLASIKYEVERKRESNSPEHLTRLKRTLELVLSTHRIELPALPSWFVPSYAVACAEPFDMGSFGEVARGTWDGRRVVVKRMFEIDDEAKKTFAVETQVWAPLEHKNVVKLLAACHVSDPLFFVCEDATGGNFRDHFSGAGSKKRGLWRLFLQAAQGLSYLHEQNIVHGDLKCNNLLIGADGVAKICDFGYSYVRLRSVGLSLQPVTELSLWKAPECLRGEGSASRPRRESDVYSFAMCIVEAATGETPWGNSMSNQISEDTIIETLRTSGYPRPEGDVFTSKQWDLVTAMTKFEYTERIELARAIEKLAELAQEEDAEQ